MTRPTANALTALALEVVTVVTKIKTVAIQIETTETGEIEIGVAQIKIKIAHANVGTATTIDIETEKTETELIVIIEIAIAHPGTTVVKETVIVAKMTLVMKNAAKKEDEKMKMKQDQMENAERKTVKAPLGRLGVRGGIARRILTGEDATGSGIIVQNEGISIVQRMVFL